MLQLREDFRSKFDDLELFLDFTEKLQYSAQRNPILKASIILILYNIVESTLTSLIIRVHDELQLYPFSILNENLQKNFLYYHFSKLSNENDFKRNIDVISNLSLSALYFPKFEEYYAKKTLFSGNVDGKKINEIFKKYSIKQVTKEKSCLLKIKSLRNILAHGEKTFNHVGREILNAELRQVSNLTKTCLLESIDNVCDFLTSKTYLNSKQASRSKP
ncbi:hypothetical protein NM96_05790 [Neisseria mucosa]|uniref:MAE_28990/MAE_18760 family HEPN-like nuclease n=1 Tax=Neisseria mucosa TaxID=488 RepID=UPI000D16749B|nr:hypothetical protein NM96_05790 [Neisseria mucosa]